MVDDAIIPPPEFIAMMRDNYSANDIRPKIDAVNTACSIRQQKHTRELERRLLRIIRKALEKIFIEYGVELEKDIRGERILALLAPERWHNEQERVYEKVNNQWIATTLSSAKKQEFDRYLHGLDEWNTARIQSARAIINDFSEYINERKPIPRTTAHSPFRPSDIEKNHWTKNDTSVNHKYNENHGYNNQYDTDQDWMQSNIHKYSTNATRIHIIKGRRDKELRAMMKRCRDITTILESLKNDLAAFGKNTLEKDHDGRTFSARASYTITLNETLQFIDTAIAHMRTLERATSNDHPDDGIRKAAREATGWLATYYNQENLHRAMLRLIVAFREEMIFRAQYSHEYRILKKGMDDIEFIRTRLLTPDNYRSALMDGDIIMNVHFIKYFKKEFVSNIISKFTRSSATHVGIYIDGKIAEANLETVSWRPGKPLLVDGYLKIRDLDDDKHDIFIVLRHKDMTDALRARMRQYIGEKCRIRKDDSGASVIDAHGKEAGEILYDLKELVGQLLSKPLSRITKKRLLKNDNGYFCSEFANECYAQAGIHLTPYLGESFLVSPKDILECPRLEFVYFADGFGKTSSDTVEEIRAGIIELINHLVQA